MSQKGRIAHKETGEEDHRGGDVNIALIPARGGSKRIPRKNMMDFCGMPLFLWSVRQAQASKLIDKVVVSTDDDEISACAVEYGADVVRRGKANATQTLDDVVSHFLANYEKPNKIVLLQPTSPIRLPGDIDRCIDKGRSGSAFSGHWTNDVFLWDHWRNPQNFYRGYRKLFGVKQFLENGSIYFFKPGYDRYGSIPKFYPMHKWQSVEIDEPEDVEIVEFFMKKYII